MKQFFKTTFACVLGVLIASILMTYITIFVFTAITAFSKKSYTAEKGTIFHLKMEGELIDRAQEDPLAGIMKDFNSDKIGLDEILSGIEEAKTNNNIAGIFLEVKSFTAGFASLEEIREALLDFKKSGKFIIAYADNYIQKGYYLATVADKIIINPIGMLSFDGLSSDYVFYKNALEKLGIEMQVFRVGTFKSAVEPFIVEKMSDANREQTSVYLGTIWNNLLNNVSIERKIPADSLNSYANMLITLQPTQKSVELNLVDTMMYRNDVMNMLQDLVNKDKGNKLKLAGISDIAGIEKSEAKTNNQIAILYAVGEIDGSDKSKGIQSAKIIEEIETIKSDSTIKAVVFRVNSPGGSAFGSEQIWDAITKLKKVKPVIVSMGDYAASGGYYISCNAHRIFAEPTTLTGSIGIFGLVPNASEFLTDKIGLTFDEVKTNRFGQFMTLTRPMNREEKNRMQAYVENGYKLFVSRCAEGRKTSVEDINKIAEGRVWAGVNAKEIGLIDELGGLNDAIDCAAKFANLKDYKIQEFPEKKDYLDELLNQLYGGATTQIAKIILGADYHHYSVLKYIRQIDPIQARMGNITIE